MTRQADVITCSLVSPSGWSTEAWGVVASRLVQEGVVVTVAAGDNGAEGAYFASNGASGELVLAVASVEASELVVPSMNVTVSFDGVAANTSIVGYMPAFDPIPYTLDGFPIVPLAVDACEPLPATFQNYSEALVLLGVASCGPMTQQQNLLNAGANNIIFFPNNTAMPLPLISFFGGWFLYIEPGAAAAINSSYQAGANITVSFPTQSQQIFVGFPNYGATGLPNYFSAWGPLNDLAIKPDIAAPGGNIVSTTVSNGFGTLSSTWAAAPYIAGVAALYIGKYGGRKSNPGHDAAAIAMRILSSGMSEPYFNPYVSSNLFPFNAPVAQVGTGLVNASRVLDYTTSLSFTKFALNDTRYFAGDQSVHITNGAGKEVRYTFSLQPAAGLETWIPYNASEAGTPRVAYISDLTPSTIVPGVRFPEGSFTVAPGQTRTAE